MPAASRSLVLLGLAAAAWSTSVEGFVVRPAPSTASTATPQRLLASTVSPTSTPEPPTPSPLPPEEAARRRAALKEALLQSLLAASGQGKRGVDPVLACPVTLQPLKPEVRLAGPFGEVRSLVTPTGDYRYPETSVFLDLVPAEDRSVDLGALSFKPMQDIFRSPFTSFLYERGWRDNFKLSGFPGIDQEFEDLMQFMRPVLPGNGTILDLSCGSGLMTRRLVKKGGWARVLAADFSESMCVFFSA